MKIVHGSLRHREQSEATQTKGLQLRLSLGCFAVANKKQTVTTLILLEKSCTEKEKRRCRF